jgi:hypothetical protein
VKREDSEPETGENGRETEAWAGLGATWREAEHDAPAPVSTVEIERRAGKFSRTVRWRNARELVACALLIAWGAHGAMTSRSFLESIPSLAMVIAVAWVGAQLVVRGRNLSPPAPSATTGEYLAFERAQLDRQRQLLRRVRRWYLAPLLAPILLGSVVHLVLVHERGDSLRGALGAELVSLSIVAAVFLLVDRLNARAATKLEDRLKALGGE